MLTNSFCIFKGLSESAEHRLWHQGCLNWDAFMRETRLPFKKNKIKNTIEEIKIGRLALKSRLYDYFISRLPNAHKARVLFEQGVRIGCLDIETTGLSRQDSITIIGLLTNEWMKVFVEGKNLSEFITWISQVDILVSFNGKRFDVPFIEKHFKMNLLIPHVDLLDVLHALGCSGGLKKCEKQAGAFNRKTEEIDGKKAIGLWEQYTSENNSDALNQLVLYNVEDILALWNLAVWCYKKSMSSYPKRIQVPKYKSLDDFEIPVF